MRSYTRIATFVQIPQKTWPPCDFENSDWSIFKKLLLKNRWRDWIEIWYICSYEFTLCFSWSNRSSAHLEQKSTQIRIMGITNCTMHNNDSTQCVGLVSTNQDNFWGQSLHWNPMGNNIFIFFLRTAEQNLTKFGRDVSCEVLKSCPGLY
jgi:hypothetical protein